MFSADFVVNVFLQIASGLQVLHNNGIFHSNLKLTNVLLFGTEQDVVVKITDFTGSLSNYICSTDNLMS